MRRLLSASILLNLMCVLHSALAQIEEPVHKVINETVDETTDFNYNVFADSDDHELEDYDYEDDQEEYNLSNVPSPDNETDYNFPINDRARWSYAPGFVEKKCTKKCKKEGKPFGRLLATKCTCLCPMNARQLDLCATIGACDKFCASRGFAQGGDCVFNNVCFCTCGKKSAYDINQVFTTPASETVTEMYNILFYNTKWRKNLKKSN